MNKDIEICEPSTQNEYKSIQKIASEQAEIVLGFKETNLDTPEGLEFSGKYIEYIELAEKVKDNCDMQYNKLRKLAYDMYNAIKYLSTDGSKARKCAEAFYHYINYEEKL